MVEDFLKEYSKLIAQFPEKIKIQRENLEGNVAEITIYAYALDIGKIIGKNGKTIQAIKSVISASRKENLNYKITVKSIE